MMSTSEEIVPLVKCPPRCPNGYRCKKNICVANTPLTAPKEKIVKVKTTVKVPKEKKEKVVKVKTVKVPKEKAVKAPKEKVVKPTNKTKKKKLIISDSPPSPIKAKTPTPPPIKAKTPTPPPPVKAKTPTPPPVVKAKTPTPPPVKAKTPTPLFRKPIPIQASVPKNQLKYCCPSRRNPNECSYISTNIKHKGGKYAIMTLIFGGDAYLPGVLLLGSSIRRVYTPDIKNVELCCMVTKDVSSTARGLISKIYDKIIDVDYIEIDPSLIRHSNPKMRALYAKTLTKLRIFELTQYDKILFLDADMLVLKHDIFGLFNLGTPACIYMGTLSRDVQEQYFKGFAENGKLFKKFQKYYCNVGNKELHGSRIPYTKGVDDERTASGMNIETSLMLIRPGHGIARERNDFLEELKKPIRGDTEVVSRMFTDRIHAIDPRFFGRGVNPYEHDELIVLDLYGTIGKPWDVDRFPELTRFISEGDLTYWWETYISMYQTQYYDYDNPILDKLYQSIMKNKIIQMHLPL